MPDNQKQPAPKDVAQVDRDRRNFLRNSIYAAYATPLITALLVAEESAAGSGCPPGLQAKCLAGSDDPRCRKCP